LACTSSEVSSTFYSILYVNNPDNSHVVNRRVALSTLRTEFIIIIIIIIIITTTTIIISHLSQDVCSLVRLDPAVNPTAQASDFNCSTFLIICGVPSTAAAAAVVIVIIVVVVVVVVIIIIIILIIII
jgi:hypothetical protein